MAIVLLTKGFIATVDNEDAVRVQKYKWYLSTDKNKNVLYAKTKINGVTTGLHRFILSAKKGQIIDHKDGDGLNNQKNNLRFCTLKENRANSRISKNNKSGYKGVFLDKRRKKFTSCIRENYKSITLGYFDSAQEAARAYNKKAIELFGEFALLNKI